MTKNEYAKLMKEKHIISNKLRDLRNKLIFVEFRLVSKHYGKFHLRSFINFVLNTSPELLESCRTAEGGSDYVYLNGSKEDLTAMLELSLDHFDITKDHCLYNGFQLILDQINIFEYDTTIFATDTTMLGE